MKAWLKYILVVCIRQILKGLYCFKIKNDMVIFNSYGGKQYSCSPKYITEYILRNTKEKYEIIWAFNEIRKFSFLEQEGIKLIKFKSLQYHYYALRAKVFICNGYIPSYIPFRKSQFVISTWHGGGAYKRGGLDIIDGIPNRKLMELSNSSLDIVLSSCSRFTEIFSKASLIPHKSFMSCGLPRNDILVRKNKDFLYKKINLKYNIPLDSKILLYAPTFRSDIQSLEGNFTHAEDSLDCEKLKEALALKFGGKWCILFRAHYYLKSKGNNAFVDVTNYPDMQELLYVADILITDYSSCMWDFSLTFKPCFIFATDIDKYKQERDFYTPMQEWPFPIANTNDSLINNIHGFNNNCYINQVKKHHHDLGSYEQGHATEEVVTLISKACGGK